MTTFRDRGVLVTGAARGIGFAIARAFLERGARVALNDRDEAALQAAVAQLPGEPLAVAGDVREPEAVEAFVAHAAAGLGRLDVVVSNAGIYPSQAFLEMTPQQWDEVMAVNARGAFLVCQAAARRMVAQEHSGSIVAIGSGSARFAREGAAHYCASKAALEMLVRVMALELARYRIRVNAVSPGVIDVPGGPSLAADYLEAVVRRIPWGRLGRPEDVAEVVVLVCDPRAEYLTGEIIAVDGGLAAGRFGLPRSG